jgi:hypothetical protein
MPNLSDAPAFCYQLAWIGGAALCACYILIATAFHWSSERKIRVTRYDPPEGMSAGVAAYLVESGRCERAFAAALIALASKGYIKIQQQKDWFVLERLREPDEALPLDDSVIPAALFPSDLQGLQKFLQNGKGNSGPNADLRARRRSVVRDCDFLRDFGPCHQFISERGHRPVSVPGSVDCCRRLKSSGGIEDLASDKFARSAVFFRGVSAEGGHLI